MLYKIFHPIKNLYKRLRYGAGCCDIFNADYYMAKKILPVLKQYKIHRSGYPLELTKDEYQIIVDKIIWSFETYFDDSLEDRAFEEKKSGNSEALDSFYNKRQEGFELFGKYYRSLWL